MTKPPIGPSLIEIEQTLDLPPGIFGRLTKDSDDWAFVIQAHALVEAALNHALVAAYKAPDAADIFARLDTSDATKGKLAFAKARNILGTEHRRFIRTLSTLRNDLVHDIRNVEFTFAKYVAAMDGKTQRDFHRNLSAIFAKSAAYAAVKDNDPRWIINASVVVIAALCYTTKRKAELENELSALQDSMHAEGADADGIARSFLAMVLDAVREKGSFTIRRAQDLAEDQEKSEPEG